MRRADWRETTWYLVFCCMVFNWGNILFGIDVASFGALQALPSWLVKFGDTRMDGSKYLPTSRQSIMNSVVWLGKIAGTALFVPLIERSGFKKTLCVGSAIQIVGIIIEISAKEWIQFTVGRILTYMAVGIMETTVPAYESELAPAPLRGFFAGNVQVFVHIGAIWGSGMSRAFANELDQRAWMIPVGVQMIPAVLLIALVPFCIESPRWLVSHGKKEHAITALARIRPKRHRSDGLVVSEVEALDEAYKESLQHGEAGWLDLFTGTHLRRAVLTIFFFNQTTGQQFANVYGPTFFRSMGLSNERIFTYTILIPVAGLFGCLAAIMLADTLGRRFLCATGAALAALFACLIAVLGSKPNSAVNTTYANVVIASLILLNGSCKFGVSSQCYLVASEIGGTQLRKKTLAWATVNDTIFAFIVTFCAPYLLDGPQVQLGARIGYIFMGCAILALLWSVLSLPELKGRSLEEVDDLFDQKLWAWQFNRAKTSGVGVELSQMHVAGQAEAKYRSQNIEMSQAHAFVAKVL